MNQTQSCVTALGLQAHQILKAHRHAAVAGTGRRGIFLQSPQAPTLYLSRESFHGPVTVNFRDPQGALSCIQNGARVDLSPEQLYFPDLDARIAVQQPLIWQPGLPPEPAFISPELVSRVIQQARSRQPGSPFLPLLDYAAGGSGSLPEDLSWAADPLQAIRSALAGGNAPAALPSLARLLGCGPGLTPLGDDLLLGLLLTWRRANCSPSWGGEPDPLIADLLEAASHKTTTVSWSLLKCAWEGSADERLIRVLDGLIAGRAIPDDSLDSLLSWGSSSGMGVLAGMLLALTTKDRVP